MVRYQQPALEEFTDQQVRFAPPARRLEHLRRAETLLAETDSNREYPYQYVIYRITDFRPDAYPDLLIRGQDLVGDLRLLIGAMARSLPAMPVETMAEPVLTLEEMSKKLNVTTKTINRWRKKGLIGVPVLVNGRRHVGFLPSLVDPFLNANKGRVEKSGQFTQLTEVEKDEILRQARRFVRLGAAVNLTEVSKRIGRRIGRAAETVRYTIRNFDRAHPDQALFPLLTGPMDPATKQMIFSSFRRGIPVDTLAKRFSRTRSSMYRVINEIRAQRLMDLPLDYIGNPSFDDSAMEPIILADMPGVEDFEDHRRQMRIPKDAPPELASLYETPLLNKDQEQHLFRKMNFLKFKASRLLEEMKTPTGRIDPHKVRRQDLDKVEELVEQANLIKDQLINCNMRLVVSIAKRHGAASENFFELLSDGNMSLIRAVEKFDYSRGNKFSTYASWAIMKNFARSIPEEKNRRERYLTGAEELFDAAPDNRTDEQECLASAEQASHKVNRLLEYLDPREREIIRMRAGLDNEEGMTLEKIGEKLGITKERVRQLNVRAMKKLRSLVEVQREEV
ncbi:MAG: sigma-70 family RNA polymerase sigma factor [Gemmataceae bacterium]|nr:sigma-70 family RNA polymerase sigma factor [Gemmataceae bacterium]MCI0738914.1 sigma-70 family RNA polymerase sigma factor [Gemmataceae bacterium]